MDKQKRANELLVKAISMVKSEGIQTGKIIPNVKLNSKAKARWGKCKQLPSTKLYLIEINPELFQNEDALLETLIHEVLHTVKDSMNHGSIWKKNANKINVKYKMNIKTTNSAADKGITIEKIHKYIVECEVCKTQWDTKHYVIQ